MGIQMSAKHDQLKQMYYETNRIIRLVLIITVEALGRIKVK